MTQKALHFRPANQGQDEDLRSYANLAGVTISTVIQTAVGEYLERHAAEIEAAQAHIAAAQKQMELARQAAEEARRA